MVYWKKKKNQNKKKKNKEKPPQDILGLDNFFETLSFENLYLKLRYLIENIEDENFLKKKIFPYYQKETTDHKIYIEIFLKLYYSLSTELTIKFFDLYDKNKSLNENFSYFSKQNNLSQRQQFINVLNNILTSVNKKYIRPAEKPHHTINPKKKVHFEKQTKFLDLDNNTLEVEIDKNPIKKKSPETYNLRCQEIKNAPWYPQKPIKGFVVYGKNNPFAINVKVYDNWYKAGASFYKNACEKKRKFNKGKVGYLTFSNQVIIEDEKMYSDYIKWFNNESLKKEPEQDYPKKTPTKPSLPLNKKKKIIEKYQSCDHCNKKIKKNKYNTIHKGKKKYFCNEKCFNEVIP
jgi:hypothetical protein